MNSVARLRLVAACIARWAVPLPVERHDVELQLSARAQLSALSVLNVVLVRVHLLPDCSSPVLVQSRAHLALLLFHVWWCFPPAEPCA